MTQMSSSGSFETGTVALLRRNGIVLTREGPDCTWEGDRKVTQIITGPDGEPSGWEEGALFAVFTLGKGEDVVSLAQQWAGEDIKAVSVSQETFRRACKRAGLRYRYKIIYPRD